MNPEKHVNLDEQLELEEQGIGEPNKPTQGALNRWYKHTSNRERFISQNQDVYEDNIISPNPLE